MLICVNITDTHQACAQEPSTGSEWQKRRATELEGWENARPIIFTTYLQRCIVKGPCEMGHCNETASIR